MDLKYKLCIIFLVIGSSISTSASAVTAASTTSTSTSAGNKPPRPKWLHCINCKSPFANAWDLMVHVQTAHMMNIYQLADTTKLQNVSFVQIFAFIPKHTRAADAHTLYYTESFCTKMRRFFKSAYNAWNVTLLGQKRTMCATANYKVKTNMFYDVSYFIGRLRTIC